MRKIQKEKMIRLLRLGFCVATFFLMACQPSVQEVEHGIVVRVKAPEKEQTASVKKVRLEVVNEHIIRVSATAENHFSAKKSLMASFDYPAEKTWTVEKRENGSVILATSAVRAIVSPDGTVSFTDADGHPILSEKERMLVPMTDPQKNKEGKHKRAYTIRQLWHSADDEAYFGLGQHQSDEFNYKNRNEQLFQYNTKVSVPFIVSNRGYGILWDNTSFSRWGDARDYLSLDKAFKVFDREGSEGGLTGTYASPAADTLVRVEPFLGFENEQANKQYLPHFPLDDASVSFEGYIEPSEAGIYQFLLYYAGYVRVIMDEKEVVGERWRTAWNPNSYKFSYPMEEGKKVHLLVEWKPDGGTSYLGLRALSPCPSEAGTISFWSEMGDDEDYYFVDGQADSVDVVPSFASHLSDLDRVIAGYRAVTGKAQVMPKWAMGFWQSRERYNSSDDILSVLSEFRRRQLPIDNIVQDWFYWKEDEWGSHEYDPLRFPDPKAMIDSIHALNGHYMLSVWPKFYCTTEHFREFDAHGWMYRQAVVDSIRDWVGKGYVGSFYDAYSPGARRLFWQQMKEHLYSRYPIDAWWMDASEPNVKDCQEMSYMKALCNPTELGSSTEYLLAYALMNAEAIYQGQREENPDQRVFLLTRNGFAGLQRYSTAVWSGDIGTRWEDMKAQISAGINFSMSGIPFWGMDIGGFCVEKRYERAWRSGANLAMNALSGNPGINARIGSEVPDALAVDEWRELQTRWFQFGAFVPLFRSHGQYPPREPWNLAPAGHPAYKSWEYYARLRYRLMPYIYSLDGMVHFADYTMMRALAMDFTADKNTAKVGDQFMLGPSLMVSPVYEYGAREREVYFPEHKGGWYDFYTGEHITQGECKLCVSAPYERIPLHVPAGAIIPMGPDMEYSNEKPLQEINLMVYGGSDGSFAIYEDDGERYDYEKGWYNVIPISYDDATATLSVGESALKMPFTTKDKCFNVTYVTPSGTSRTSFTYTGEPLAVCLSGGAGSVK